MNSCAINDVKFREIFSPEILYFMKYFQKFHAVLCIVHCNKVSKPVKGKYLLCMNNIMYLLLA